MLRRTLIVVASLTICASANAWGFTGHRQIADLAWTQLSRTAKVNLAKILMFGDTVTSRDRNDVFSVPNQPVTDEFLEKTVRPAFVDAATWADAIKGGKSKLFEQRIDSDNAASPGTNPPATGNPGEEVRCKTWHYYDKPIAPKDHPEPTHARESNAIRSLALMQAEFEREQRAGATDKRNQAYALYWITHIYGDLHQPLHCVANFHYDAHGDEGGNTFKTGLDHPTRQGEKQNLHSLWDAGIDRAIAADSRFSKKPPFSEVSQAWLTDTSVLPKKGRIENLDYVSWVEEGWVLAQELVYKDLKPGEVPSAQYMERYVKICKAQAILAAFRLAEYLNRTIGK